MMDNNRKTAYHTLMDIETKSSYSNLALNHHIKVSRPKDKEITERGGGGVKYCPHCGAVVTGRFCPECGSVV